MYSRGYSSYDAFAIRDNMVVILMHGEAEAWIDIVFLIERGFQYEHNLQASCLFSKTARPHGVIGALCSTLALVEEVFRQKTDNFV